MVKWHSVVPLWVRQFCAAVGKGDGDTAGLNVAEVTEEWSIVAGGATVR